VVQLDSMSESHQALLKANTELRKDLDAERSKVVKLEKNWNPWWLKLYTG